MQRKLIAIDLDGTTLNNQQQITKKTKYILNELTKQGHIVSIVTGRPYRNSSEYYQFLNMKTPMVNFNGAWCHNPSDPLWKNAYHKQLDRDLALSMLSLSNNADVQLIAAESMTEIYTNSTKYIPYPGYLPKNENRCLPLSRETLLENPTSLHFFTTESAQSFVQSEIMDTFGESVEVRTWGGDAPCLEVVSAGVQKAMGVEQIAENYGIKRQDIIAFGDEDNDFEMIQHAGHGVVMQNGIEKLKDISDDLTKFSNHEDGLAHYLNDYFSLNVAL